MNVIARRESSSKTFVGKVQMSELLLAAMTHHFQSEIKFEFFARKEKEKCIKYRLYFGQQKCRKNRGIFNLHKFWHSVNSFLSNEISDLTR
jgi:hypothetical protein